MCEGGQTTTKEIRATIPRQPRALLSIFKPFLYFPQGPLGIISAGHHFHLNQHLPTTHVPLPYLSPHFAILLYMYVQKMPPSPHR